MSMSMSMSMHSPVTTRSGSALRLTGARSLLRTSVRRSSSSSVTRTQAVKQEAPPSAVAASTKNEAQMLTEKYGFSNVEEGMFGFKPFSELFVGRLAMAGFAVQLVEEILGHGGFLYQVGFQTPDDNLFLALAAFFGVAVALAHNQAVRRRRLGRNDDA